MNVNNCTDIIVSSRVNENFEFNFNMQEFVVCLGKMGETVFTGSSCTLGYTELYLQAKELCIQVIEACDAGILLAGRYNQVVDDTPGDLEVAFEFLKSADEDMAIYMIKCIGESCEALAVETHKFKDEIIKIQTSIENLQVNIQQTYTSPQQQNIDLVQKEARQKQAFQNKHVVYKQFLSETYQYMKESNEQQNVNQNQSPENRGVIQRLVPGGCNFVFGQNEKGKKKSNTVQIQQEKAFKKIKQRQAEKYQQWLDSTQENSTQENMVILDQQFGATDDHSLLKEGDPFFKRALKHTKELLDILQGLAQSWEYMGNSYKNKLPEYVSSETHKKNQEERKQLWKSDEFLSVSQMYIYTWKTIKNMCNVMNEIRITQKHVLSYVANEPTDFVTVRGLLAREAKKLPKREKKLKENGNEK
eukprot:TRINITY_DN41323_c0_g1_i1.p1 TRINITY_DN41323_c0_g1~~TRINITY_DN41323_c0_g1_i1.p1  ORF type:complete len:417 (-),score=40.41 TRINITY_DN41323_c0_g1_i1:42-1292(-)